MFTQWQEGGALGLLVGIEFFPFRATDGAEKDGIGGPAGFEGIRGQGVALSIDGGATDETFGKIELKREFFADGGEDAKGFGHDFGADAVPGEDCDFKGAHASQNAGGRNC